MGRSGGTGSPNWFVCSVGRKEWPRAFNWPENHEVELTGRFREYRSARRSVLGSRSCSIAFEYQCSCGHVGWSNHMDLGKRAGVDHWASFEAQWEAAMDYAAAKLRGD